MKTVFTFVVLTFAISAIMYLGGVTSTNEFSAISYIVNLTQGNLSTSTLWIGIVAILSAISIGATALAIRGTDVSTAITIGMYSLSLVLLVIVGDFVGIIKAVGVGCTPLVNGVFVDGGLCSIGYWIVWLYGILMVVGFIFALIDLVRGTD